jgi:hypothetical protein
MAMRSLWGFLRREWAAALPALVVALAFGGFWLCVQFSPAFPHDRASTSAAFIGWIGLMTAVGTVGVIIWAAGGGARAHGGSVRRRTPPRAGRAGARGAGEPFSLFGGEGRRVFLGFALAGDAAGILAVAVGVTTGLLGWRTAIQLYIVMAAWMGMWSGVAWLLGRWGAGIGVALSLTCAMLLMAGPVTLVPLARLPGAPRAFVNRWQPLVVTGIAGACPMLAALDAMKPEVRLDWPQLPQMYRMSGLGQEIPIELPRWWIAAAVYAGVGLVGAISGGRWRRG